MSVTDGFPAVTVPVLSRTTVVILCAVSNTSALRMSIPMSEPLPIPTMIAVGVASPRAHGQAIIRTDTKLKSANTNVGSGPKNNQIMKVSIAMPITTGTK